MHRALTQVHLDNLTREIEELRAASGPESLASPVTVAGEALTEHTVTVTTVTTPTGR